MHESDATDPVSDLLVQVTLAERDGLERVSARLEAWLQASEDDDVWMLRMPGWADAGAVEFVLRGLLSMRQPPTSAADVVGHLAAAVPASEVDEADLVDEADEVVVLALGGPGGVRAGGDAGRDYC